MDKLKVQIINLENYITKIVIDLNINNETLLHYIRQKTKLGFGKYQKQTFLQFQLEKNGENIQKH